MRVFGPLQKSNYDLLATHHRWGWKCWGYAEMSVHTYRHTTHVHAYHTYRAYRPANGAADVVALLWRKMVTTSKTR